MNNTKELPILFSTPMVQSTLEGRKTQTRRTSRLDYINSLADKINFCECWEAEDMTHTPADKPGYAAYFGNNETDEWYQPVYSPYGRPGDILWVRETFKAKFVKGCLEEFKRTYPNSHPWLYAADGESVKGYGQWKPSIHMPKEAARIWLKVKSIRVERLQDISEEDACAEGIEGDKHDELWRDYALSAGDAERCRFTEPSKSFQSLWQSINGSQSWQANPWVWVVEFEVLSTTGRPDNI